MRTINGDAAFETEKLLKITFNKVYKVNADKKEKYQMWIVAVGYCEV